MVTPNSCCTTVMVTSPGLDKPIGKPTSPLSEKTPLTRSLLGNEEDTTSPKEYGLVQGRRVMFSLTVMVKPEDVALNEHCKLRQSSEMVQSPEEAMNKVCLLTLLSEAHIWDRVALRTQVGGSSGGDVEGDGDGDGEGDGRAVEVGSVVVTLAQTSAQCM